VPVRQPPTRAHRVARQAVPPTQPEGAEQDGRTWAAASANTCGQDFAGVDYCEEWVFAIDSCLHDNSDAPIMRTFASNMPQKALFAATKMRRNLAAVDSCEQNQEVIRDKPGGRDLPHHAFLPHS
jgi:hypothetical protein